MPVCPYASVVGINNFESLPGIAHAGKSTTYQVGVNAADAFYNEDWGSSQIEFVSFCISIITNSSPGCANLSCFIFF